MFLLLNFYIYFFVFYTFARCTYVCIKFLKKNEEKWKNQQKENKQTKKKINKPVFYDIAQDNVQWQILNATEKKENL